MLYKALCSVIIFTSLVGVSLIGFRKVLADDVVLMPVYIPLQGSNSLAIERNNVFNRIAWCESRNTSDARSKSSTAKGRFQFLDGTWKYYGTKLWGDFLKEKNVLDYNDNSELAWYVFTKFGTGDWDASKNCWFKET